MAKKTTKSAAKTINPKVTVHIETNSRDAFAVLNTLSRAAKCAYCSEDNADEAVALQKFIGELRDAITQGVVTAAKQM